MDSATSTMSSRNGIEPPAATTTSMEDAMQNFIKNHVLSNPITCETTKTKTVTEQKEERIKRPMNAFMVFSHQARKMIAKKNPNLKNSDLSKFLGTTWQNFSEEKKAMFKRKAEELRAKHKKDHPSYKYQPRRKKAKMSSAATTTSMITEKPARATKTTINKKITKIVKEYHHSDSSDSPSSSNNDLYIDESESPMSDHGFILGPGQPHVNYSMQDNPFDYHMNHMNSYGQSNGSSSNSSNHVNYPNHGHHRRTPSSVLTPPSTPINSVGDSQSPNLSGFVPSHFYAHQNYRNGHEFTNEKLSPMHYPSYSYNTHQPSTVFDSDWFNGGCMPSSADYNSELPPLDLQSNYPSQASTYGYDSLKFNGNVDPSLSNCFEDEKKFNINTGLDAIARPSSTQNGYVHFTSF